MSHRDPKPMQKITPRPDLGPKLRGALRDQRPGRVYPSIDYTQLEMRVHASYAQTWSEQDR